MIAQLSRRERIVLAAGAVVVAATLLLVGIIEPYRNAVNQLEDRIASRQRQVSELEAARREYLSLQKQLAEADRRLDKAEGFSLFSFVENLATTVATREKLVYMRPQPPTSAEGYKEESVEIKVEKIRLDQLVRMLYAIDSAEAFLQVRNLRLKTRFEDRSLLDAVLTVSAFRREP